MSLVWLALVPFLSILTKVIDAKVWGSAISIDSKQNLLSTPFVVICKMELIGDRCTRCACQPLAFDISCRLKLWGYGHPLAASGNILTGDLPNVHDLHSHEPFKGHALWHDSGGDKSRSR